MVCATTRPFELWLLWGFLSVEWEVYLAKVEPGTPMFAPLPQAGSPSLLAPFFLSAASRKPFQQ